jgi:hypothetical protein
MRRWSRRIGCSEHLRPGAHALSYLASFGDLVQFGDQLGAWDTRDHEKDQGFQLDLAATTVNNLVAIRDHLWRHVADRGW